MASGTVNEYFGLATQGGSGNTAGYAGPEPQFFKGGFEAFLDDAIQSSGGRVMSGSDRKTGAVFKGGPLRGLTLDQGIRKLRQQYASLSDQQRQQWESVGDMLDVRSQRELDKISQQRQGYAGPMPGQRNDVVPPGGNRRDTGNVIFNDLAASPAGSGPDFRAPISTPGPHFYDRKGNYNGSVIPSEPALSQLPSAVGAIPGNAKNVALDKSGHVVGFSTDKPTGPAMIDGKPAAQAIADLQKANDDREGITRVAGTKDASGKFQPPTGGGELIGVSGGKPLYSQKQETSYAGPVPPQKPNPTQASAATGVETPGAALKKEKGKRFFVS